MKKSPSILWVVPKWTLPATDGARVATERLVKNLALEGANLDYVCLGLPGERIDPALLKVSWKVGEVFYTFRDIPRSKLGKRGYYLKKFMGAPGSPITLSSFQSRHTRNFLISIAERKDYDWVVFDGLHAGAGAWIDNGIKFKTSRRPKVLYRAHNIENSLWGGAAKREGNWFLKKFFQLQQKNMLRFETRFIRECDLVAPISLEDQGWMKDNCPRTKLCLARMGMNFSNPLPPREGRKNVFLFLGRLDWGPNRDGLEWFLRQVWPHVDKSRARLKIAGSGDGNWVKNYEHLEGVEFLGFVNDLNSAYSSCHATVAPIFFGSGTRIKVVESYAKGRPVITNPMGAQGANLRGGIDYICVKDKAAWINAINEFDREKANRILINGRERLEKDFDEKRVARTLYSSLSGL